MSLKVDLGEFVGAFLSEAEELISASNARLLEVERAAVAGKRDARAVRELFRALHTLKGLSAMVNVEPVVAIAHAMESVVRAADRAGGAVEPKVVERLFDALRAIEQRLAAVERGEAVAAAPGDLLERFERSTGAAGRDAPADAKVLVDLDPAIEKKLEPFEKTRLQEAVAQGKRAVRLDFSPSPRRASQGLNINVVRERVGAIAEIIKVVPRAVPASDDAPSGLTFVLLAVTTADDDELSAALGPDAAAVQTIAGGATGAEPTDEAALAELEPIEARELDPSPERRNVLRVDVARIDDALERLASLIVTRSRLARASAELSVRGVDVRELTAIVQENARQLRDLRASILRLRTVPFAELVARLALVLRSMRRASEKDVRLVSDANDAELDKAVADRVFPALVHLLRNAVDHGVEAPAERVRRGKPPQAQITIAYATHRNRQLEIRVSDDGGGLDRAKVAAAAGVASLDDDGALLEAICRPGMSTREVASDVSGRGMGMDIVRKIVVDQLGGELALETRGAEGTTFVLRVPLSVAIVEAFTVQCDDERFCVPVSTVEEIIEIDVGAIVRGPGGSLGSEMVLRRGEAVPLVLLARALGRAEATSERARHALVVRRGGGAVAFQLDRVVGQQETVVRPLIDPLVQVPGIAGSADLGDGRATLVLDLFTLAGALESRRPTPRPTRRESAA